MKNSFSASALARFRIMAILCGVNLVLLVIYMVAKYAFNAFDAWLARLRGVPVENGHPVAEALAALVSAPVLAAIRLQSRQSTTRQMASL